MLNTTVWTARSGAQRRYLCSRKADFILQRCPTGTLTTDWVRSEGRLHFSELSAEVEPGSGRRAICVPSASELSQHNWRMRHLDRQLCRVANCSRQYSTTGGRRNRPTAPRAGGVPAHWPTFHRLPFRFGKIGASDKVSRSQHSPQFCLRLL